MSASRYAIPASTTGQILEGFPYEVTGTGAITYNSVVVNAGSSFTGVRGVTSYTISSGSPEVNQSSIVKGISIGFDPSMVGRTYPEDTIIKGLSIGFDPKPVYKDKTIIQGISIGFDPPVATVKHTIKQKLARVTTSPDADATAYINAIGTLTTQQQTAVRRLVDYIKKGQAWVTGLELNPLLGGLSGCLVKLRQMEGSASSVTNNGFVSGDYSDTTGLTSTSGTKWLDPGINASARGLSATNIFAGVSLLSNADTSGPVLGDNNASGSPGIYIGNQVGNTYQILNGAFMLSFLNNGTRTDFRDFSQARQLWTTSATLTTDITLFKSTLGGTVTYGRGSMGFYVVAPALTQSQINVIQRGVFQFLKDVGRVPDKKFLVCMGDSIMEGYDSSYGSIDRCARLTANHFDLLEANLGWAGCKLVGTERDNVSIFGRRQDILKYGGDIGKVLIMGGTNDMIGGIDLIQYQSQYGQIIKELIAFGIPSADILVCPPPPYNNDPGNQGSPVRDAAQAACTSSGGVFKDVYGFMKSNGYVPSGVHPNVSQHAYMKTVITS